MKGWVFFFLLLGVAMPRLEAQSVSKTIRVSFEIEPVAFLEVVSEQGVQAVRLGPIAPRAEIPTRSLKVSIKTNTRQRYHVYQDFQGELVSPDGTSFPPGRILVQATNGEEGGMSEVPNFVTLSEGEIAVFTSRPEGGPDTFYLHYAVDNQELFAAGLYYGNFNVDIRME